MKPQLQAPLHAGQLRYHDFSKLREMYYQNLLRNTYSSNPFTSSSLWRISTAHSNTTRSFFTWNNKSSSTNTNPITRAFTHLQLKSLEREANANPHDAQAQYAFYSELAEVYPMAFLARIRNHPRSHNNNKVRVDPNLAILYLRTLQRTNSVQQLDADDLLQRLQASTGLIAPPELLSHNKLVSKAEQTQRLLTWLTTGTVPATNSTTTNPSMPTPPPPYAAAAVTAPWQHPTSSPFLSSVAAGSSSTKPLQVQIVPAAGSTRQAIVGFILRAGMILVAFSAISALMDERGIGKSLSVGSNSKHIQEASDKPKVRFDDVKGVEEAKAELEEIVLYLKDPSRFTRLGGKLPRGLLLTGPPGTGKTLLAKAIAGEADVPFFYSSGSQFEEVYVGLGAKRIRELFETAKKKAPAIIFIDEIDAVGGTRRLKDQSALKMTLNELLVQLDGFDENNGIIVIGATNFMESLDDALLRPGRFDKHVVVPLPDVGGRKEILEMYAAKTKLAKDVDLSVLARGTTGFSGADLNNLINQAALKASVDGLPYITMAVLEYAKDKILMGAERKTAVITKETARCTAYHEAGHAIVAVLTEGAMPIHKATIMPRGASLGMVTMLPEGDQTSNSLKELLANLDVAMGGRVAEELIFGKDAVTSGASSDIQNATRIARNMVTKWGFSDEIGIVHYGGTSGEENASPETRARIDNEVKRLTSEAYKRAKDILTKHSREHKLLAETLLEYETLTGDEVRDLVFKLKKPDRPVINKNGGARGDADLYSSGKGGRAKKPLYGKDDTSVNNNDNHSNMDAASEQ